MEKEEWGNEAIEYWIEEQRALLDSNVLTPVNERTFNQWKERWLKQREVMMRKEEIKQKKSKRATGWAVFSINPNLFVDDNDAVDDEEIKEESKDEE